MAKKNDTTKADETEIAAPIPESIKAPESVQALAAAPSSPRTISDGMSFDGVSIDDIDKDLFAVEELGFPPYWKPVVSCLECKNELGEKEFRCKRHPEAGVKGNRFLGIVIDRNVQLKQSGDDMIRYVMQASCIMPCQRGKTENPEPVEVQAGEFFNVSDYSMLKLENYFGQRILVSTISKSRHPTDPEKTLWKFEMRLDHSAKKLRNDERIERAKLAVKVMQEARLSGSMKAVPVLPNGMPLSGTARESAIDRLNARGDTEEADRVNGF